MSTLRGSFITREFYDQENEWDLDFDIWVSELFGMCFMSENHREYFRQKMLHMVFCSSGYSVSNLYNVLLQSSWSMISSRDHSIQSRESRKKHVMHTDYVYAGLVGGALGISKDKIIPNFWCPDDNYILPFSSSAAARESEQFFKVSFFPVRQTCLLKKKK